MKPLDPLAADWPVLSAMLDEALALPSIERGAWLEALHTGPGCSEALRSTLRELLARDGGVETGDFMSTLPRLGTGAAAAGEPQADMQIGSYRLISELGRGGMGTVWLAERSDGQLNRQVALKLPHLTWAGNLAERMARERDILATLEHPHIARLYDAGVDAMGRPWLALEYVQGRSIDAYVRERALDLQARLALLLQVCAAVAYAHSRLVIHRDLKPSNILVTDEGQVRLLDFGIAKLVQGDRTEATALTKVAGHALTPDYASPEQVRGEPLGTTSDVYSLGVIAYELLTGQRPYKLRRGTAAELEDAIATVEPPLASETAALPTSKKQLRGDLDAILNKALKKQPGERYPSVEALADDLRRHQRGHAVMARPDSRSYRLLKFCARYKLAVAAVTAVVVSLGIGLGVALWQAQQARAQEREARLSVDREDAIKNLYLETVSTVAGLSPERFAEPGAVSRVLRNQLDVFEKRYADSPGPRLGMLEAVSVHLPFLGDYEGSLAVSRRYADLLQSTGGESWRQLRAAIASARALSNLGRRPEAEEVMRRALAQWPDAPDNRSNRVLAMAEHAKLLNLLGRRDEALAILAAAVQQAQSVPLPSRRWGVETQHAMLYADRDDATALRLILDAQERYAREPRAYDNELGYGHYMVGMAYQRLGRPAEAEVALRSSMKLMDQLFGATDRDSVRTAGLLASTLAAQGRYDEARRLLEDRSAELARRPGSDGVRSAALLSLRGLENELAFGDLDAARRIRPAEDKDFAALAPVADLALYARVATRVLLWSGRIDEAERFAGRWQRSVPDHARLGTPGFQSTLAQLEIDFTRGSPEAASQSLERAEDLLARMERSGATRTHLFREAQEATAMARAASPGSAEAARQALAQLEAFESGPGLQVPGPPTPHERADALLRRARLLLAAERKADARAALEVLAPLLEGQHAQSPRRAAAARLMAAAS